MQLVRRQSLQFTLEDVLPQQIMTETEENDESDFNSLRKNEITFHRAQPYSIASAIISLNSYLSL